MASIECRRWVGISAVALTTISAAAISIAAVFFSASVCKRKCRLLASRIRDLEASLEASTEKTACERRGRVRAQQVEALDGHAVLLSGVDLVDGTPVLDIKPYLPYSDCIQNATVPKWVKAENALAVTSVSFSEDFPSSLSSCWTIAEKQSLYASVEEFQKLITEVLSWDIRSLSQQIRPHQVALQKSEGLDLLDREDGGGHESDQDLNGNASLQSLTDIRYHLVLEGIDVSYSIDDQSNIVVEKATIASDAKSFRNRRCNYSMWREKLGEKKNDVFA